MVKKTVPNSKKVIHSTLAFVSNNSSMIQTTHILSISIETSKTDSITATISAETDIPFIEKSEVSIKVGSSLSTAQSFSKTFSVVAEPQAVTLEPHTMINDFHQYEDIHSLIMTNRTLFIRT